MISTEKNKSQQFAATETASKAHENNNRQYLWNGSSNRQSENGVMIYDFFHIRWEQFGKRWSTYEKITLTFDLWPWNLIGL